MTSLWSWLQENFEEVQATLSPRRRKELQDTLFQAGNLQRIWPNLKLVSCWTEGPSQLFTEQLRRWIPSIEIQSKGLLATEGVVSIPLVGQPGSALAVHAHFLEFLEVDAAGNLSDETILAGDLRINGRYSPVLTTAGGLYRYHLKDVIECVGKVHACPLVRFVSKVDRISDLTGEKLNASFVQSSLQAAQLDTGVSGSFALVAPAVSSSSSTPPHYFLYFESETDDTALDRLGARLEALLLKNAHYSYCRDLDQLGCLQIKRVKNGVLKFENRLRELGMKSGDIKPTVLDQRLDWEKYLCF